MRRKPLQIAIDGPIGSGKSTVAAEVVLRQPESEEADGRKITVLLDGEDVSRLIRTHEIDDLVAKFGEHKEVIEEVHEKERKLANSQDVVIEGREKVYLTADVRERAKRRFAEYEAKGDMTQHSEIVRALKERDELDMKRAYAPLKKGPRRCFD